MLVRVCLKGVGVRRLKGDGMISRLKGDGVDRHKGDGISRLKGDGVSRHKGDGVTLPRLKGDGVSRHKGDGVNHLDSVSLPLFTSFDLVSGGLWLTRFVHFAHFIRPTGAVDGPVSIMFGRT